MMTAPTGSGVSGSEKLAQYARTIRGEWCIEPAAALDRIVPELGGDKYKGQLGRVGVFGGSEDYTGAPYFASMSALRTGADLAYVFTAEEAAPALKAYSPELMVTPVYSAATLSAGAAGDIEGDGCNEDDYSARAQPIVDNVASRLPRLHSLLLGPGMGRHPAVKEAAVGMVVGAREKGIPVVLDADGIAMVVANPGVVSGFGSAVLTPNANEFRLLCEMMESRARREEGALPLGGGGEPGGGGRGESGGGEGDGETAAAAAAAAAEAAAVPAPAPEQDKAGAVERLARYLGGVTVVLKGKVDIISDGRRTVACAVPGGLKRCGGIGDVLSGTMATALAWVNLQKIEGQEADELRLWAAWWACAVTRHASRRAYEAKGRASSATDVFQNVGSVVEEVAPSPPVLG
eukprot:g10374.t1